MPEFGGAIGWLNSPPLTAADIRGKVALLDVWTYAHEEPAAILAVGDRADAKLVLLGDGHLDVLVGDLPDRLRVRVSEREAVVGRVDL